MPQTSKSSNRLTQTDWSEPHMNIKTSAAVILIKVASKGSAGPKRALLCLPHSEPTLLRHGKKKKKRLEKLSDSEMAV